jgi:hypothetical protein
MSLRPLPALLLALLPLTAQAQRADEPPPVRSSELRDSVQRVERETGGRVLRVEPVRRGGQETYRMKVLTPEGRVRVMQDEHRREGRRSSRAEAPRQREFGADDSGRDNDR